MKKMYIGIIALVILIVGLYFTVRVDNTQVSNTTATYSNAGLGIEFTYQTGPDGYVLQELTPSDTTGGLLNTIVLMQTADAEREMPVGGEGPTTITIQVLKNTKKQQPGVWADANKIYSNINLKQGEVSEYVLGGANAIRYTADGLYASDNVVVAHGENVYVITGNYMDAESKIKKDFAPLLESIKFIPQPGQN